MAKSFSSSAADGYKQASFSYQKRGGEAFIQTDVCPQVGNVILDLGCGTGELSVYLAERVGPEGRVIGVDPDKERIQLARQSHGHIKNLSFAEGVLRAFSEWLQIHTTLFSATLLFTGCLKNSKSLKTCFQVLKLAGK